MKTNFKFLLFVMLSACFFLSNTACSDDDDKNPTVDYAKDIKGTYTGTVFLAGSPIATDVEISVEYASVNNVTLKMNQTIMTLPLNITCPAQVASKDGAYSVTGNTNVSLPESPLSLPVSINGTFDGKKDGTLNISVTTGKDPLVVKFEGKRP